MELATQQKLKDSGPKETWQWFNPIRAETAHKLTCPIVEFHFVTGSAIFGSLMISYGEDWVIEQCWVADSFYDLAIGVLQNSNAFWL